MRFDRHHLRNILVGDLLGACPSNVHFGLDSQRALWFLGGMANTFKSWDVDQVVLLPPSVQELVPAGHLAHFVRDLVRDSLDVSAILATYAEDRGFPPYDPTMMTTLLLYAYGQGLYASRRIAKACEERVDFMAVTARQSPDFRTISDFRKRHLSALGGLFTQVLQLCQKAGLVSLGHVALSVANSLAAHGASPNSLTIIHNEWPCARPRLKVSRYSAPTCV